MKKLSQREIQNKLPLLNDWKTDGRAIRKEWIFRDFSEAMKFINTVAELAEKYNHHPEIYNVYNRVTIRYTTHDADGLTEQDFLLASALDRIEI